MTIATIRPKELQDRLGRDPKPRLIDVRLPMEFERVHAIGAENVPLDEIDPRRHGPADGRPLYIICQKGMRSRKAVEKFAAAGFQGVESVEGGTEAWVSARLPVHRGRVKTISLERQVRIAAGSLVVLGIALAWLTPWTLALSAFVGAGLVFAGITDTCGMGMLLAKAPWNRRPIPS